MDLRKTIWRNWAATGMVLVVTAVWRGFVAINCGDGCRSGAKMSGPQTLQLSETAVLLIWARRRMYTIGEEMTVFVEEHVVIVPVLISEHFRVCSHDSIHSQLLQSVSHSFDLEICG